MRSRAPIERRPEPSRLRTTRSSIPGPAHLSGAGVYADKSFATPDVEREGGCGDLEAGEGRVAGADRQVAVVAQNDRLGSGTTPSRRGSPLSRVQCQRPSVPGKISGWIMPERQLQNLSAPNELGAARLPAPCRPKASSMLADRFHRKTMRLRETASPRSRCSQLQRGPQ